MNTVLDATSFSKVSPYVQRAMAGEIVKFKMTIISPRTNLSRHISATYVPDKSINGTVLGFNVLAFDETERHDHEEALAYIANHDSLTNLPNRRLFDDRLQHCVLRSKRHKRLSALLYLDIDHFKKINDAFGHDTGDILLTACAKRLVATVRSCDTVARLGGDEFVILMEDLQSKDNAELVAKNILKEVRLPFDFDDTSLTITTSIGIFSQIV